MTLRQIFLPGGGGGGVNATVIQRVGVALTTRLSAVLATVRAGVGISQGPTRLTITQRPAIALTTRVDSGEVVTIQRPAIALSNHIAKDAFVQKPAIALTEFRWTLASVKGSNNVTQVAVGGRTDWQTIANAAGVSDDVDSTFAGNALAARGGTLVLNYANYVDKTELTLVSVHLDYYVEVAGTVLNNADIQLQYDVGAGITTLQTITGNSSAEPITHDITAAVAGDWAKLDALVTRVRAEAALGEIWTATCDAVVARVAATRTDTV